MHKIKTHLASMPPFSSEADSSSNRWKTPGKYFSPILEIRELVQHSKRTELIQEEEYLFS